MDKALLILPIFLTTIIGIATQLENIAQDTGAKAIAFSDDMNNAMDCAARGIPIRECSPRLMEYDFSADLQEFQGTLYDIQEELSQAEQELIEAQEELLNETEEQP